MGFVFDLLTSPMLGPIRGVHWLATKVAEIADSEALDESKVRGELLELPIRLEMLRLALEHKKAGEREALLQPLRRLSSDSCLNTTYGDDMLVNAAFLVDKAREKEFDATVEGLAARYKGRIEFKYIGPAPPYSFVNIVVEE